MNNLINELKPYLIQGGYNQTSSIHFSKYIDKKRNKLILIIIDDNKITVVINDKPTFIYEDDKLNINYILQYISTYDYEIGYVNRQRKLDYLATI